MTSLTLLAGLVPSMLAGAYAHEYTHALAARLAGGRARVDHIGLFCHWEIPASRPRWVDRLINLAPALVGLGVAVVAVAIGWRPTDAPGWLAVTAWTVYALLGGVEDYALSASYQQDGRGVSLSARWDGLDAWQRLGWLGLGIFASAVMLKGLPALRETTWWYVGDALLLAGAVVAAWAMVQAEQSVVSGE